MACMEREYPLAARAMPDGSYTVHEVGSFVDAADAVGRYDPRCSLQRRDGRWEIWRQCEDGVPRRVGFSAQEKVPHPEVLVKMLRESDTWRGYDPVAATIAHNEAIVAEADRVAGEVYEEKADRLAFALGRDLDEPAQSGRLYALGDR